MSAPGDVLTSFLPDLLARRIADRPGPLPGQGGEPVEVTVLGVDVSESTSIMEDLVRWGRDGAEAVAHTLDRVFSLVADAVVEHGGSVVTQAGDEVVAVWPAAETGSPAAAVASAARAAAAVQERVTGLPPVGGYPIRLRAGIGAGAAWLLDVGHEDGRRLFVPVGPAMQEMARAQKSVPAAETGLGPAATGLLGPVAGAQPVAGGAPPALRPRTRPGPVPALTAARYLPDLVARPVGSGRAEPPAEIAPVTAVFVSLRAGPWDAEAVRVVHEASLQVLDVLARYDATVVNASQDGDGLTLVVGFGLPPTVREREAVRAGLAALDVSRALQQVTDHGIGIATGHAFCGVCGSAVYRQYMMVGPVVNLAARLMQRAQNEVLCDEVSQHLGRDRLRFSARGRMDVKGFAGPVEVYRPEWHEADPGPPTLRRLTGGSRHLPTRGRDREREELAGRLVALGLGTSTTVVVEGEPGLGKTHLAVDLLQAAGGYGPITVLTGAGDDVDPRPWHAWRRVFDKALGLSAVRTREERAQLVGQRLARWPDLAPWAPLLDDVLDLGLDGSALRDVTGRTRRENTIRVLVRLLADAAHGKPLLVVLDDCQWMDSASWELVAAVRRDVAPVMLVLLTRPLAEVARAADDGPLGTAAGVLAQLREEGALVLRLQPLPPGSTEEIARDSLGVAALDEPLRALFRSRVEGSPLFTVELAFQLRTDEVVAVVDTAAGARARVAVPAEELDRIRLPVRVEEVFRARLGALTDRQRRLVRAAGVVGTAFDERRVLAADPELDPAGVAEDLGDLERRQVVQAQPDGWRFAHAVIRDVARQSVLPSELRRRHRTLAEWYEAHGPAPADYALLARHWAEAGDPARQVEYLEAAGTRALAEGADEEAAALLRTALSLDEETDAPFPSVPDRRRAFWHDQLGEALADQNRLDEAVEQFGEALGLLGHRVPRSRPGWLARVVWEALRQLAHLVVAPRPGRGRDPAGLGQAAWVLAKLGETEYFRGAALRWTATVLAAVNLAERAGTEGVAGPAYSGLANLVGTMRLHRLAARYLERARREITVQPTGSDSPLTRGVLPDRAWQYGLTATVSEAVYLRTMNRTVDVTPMLDVVVGQARLYGQSQDLEICLAVRGLFQEATGRLRAARADFEELLGSARRRANAEHVLWGRALLVPVLLDLDRREEALSFDEEATRAPEEEGSLAGPDVRGSHVRSLVVRGLHTDALACARKALGVPGVPSFFHLPGLTALTQGCVEVLEQGRAPAAEARATTRRALRALRGYARIYPFARARHELHRGRYCAALGRHRAARRHWRRGLDAAGRAGLRLDDARLRLLLAGALPAGSPARAEHLRSARRAVDELGLRRLAEFDRRLG